MLKIHLMIWQLPLVVPQILFKTPSTPQSSRQLGPRRYPWFGDRSNIPTTTTNTILFFGLLSPEFWTGPLTDLNNMLPQT